MASSVNMKICTFLLLIFILNSTIDVSHTNEDCRVRDKYTLELWSGTPLLLWAFIPTEGVLTCMLTFHGLDQYMFYDQIVLSNQGNKVIKTVDGNIKHREIKSILNATGWTEFTFSIDNDESHFEVKVWKELALNYTLKSTVKTITIYASNISLCSEPMWTVGESEVKAIPLDTLYNNFTRLQDGPQYGIGTLDSSRSINITLSSTVPFSPIIKLDGIERFLTKNQGAIVLSGSCEEPLQPQKTIFEVQRHKQTVNINYINEKSTIKLMEFQVSQILSEIEISSRGTSFSVYLDMGLESKLLTTTPKIGTSVDNRNIIISVAVVVLVIVVAMIIIIIFIYHRYILRKEYTPSRFFIRQKKTTKSLKELLSDKDKLPFNLDESMYVSVKEKDTEHQKDNNWLCWFS